MSTEPTAVRTIEFWHLDLDRAIAIHAPCGFRMVIDGVIRGTDVAYLYGDKLLEHQAGCQMVEVLKVLELLLVWLEDTDQPEDEVHDGLEAARPDGMSLDRLRAMIAKLKGMT